MRWRALEKADRFCTCVELSDQGRTAYQNFTQAVVLHQVMRQSGHNADQIQFREILLRLSNAKVTVADWNCLMTRTAEWESVV
jgi:hypothetical protein